MSTFLIPNNHDWFDFKAMITVPKSFINATCLCIITNYGGTNKVPTLITILLSLTDGLTRVGKLANTPHLFTIDPYKVTLLINHVQGNQQMIARCRHHQTRTGWAVWFNQNVLKDTDLLLRLGGSGGEEIHYRTENPPLSSTVVFMPGDQQRIVLQQFADHCCTYIYGASTT